MNNFINIIFDGNFFFYKSFSTFKSYKSDTHSNEMTDEEQSQLIRKFAIDFCAVLNQFNTPKNIIFCLDSSSWRKKIDIISGSYKSNRSTSDPMWDNFNFCRNEFTQILKNKGVWVSRIHSAEGDDLLYFWSHEFYKSNKSSILYTSDKDLCQVVKSNPEAVISIYQQKTGVKKLIVSNGTLSMFESIEEPSIFDNGGMGNTINYIKDLSSTLEVEEVDPYKLQIEKILYGDKSDTVPSIITWKKLKREYRFNPTMIKKVIQKIEDKYNNIPSSEKLLEEEEYLDFVAQSCLNECSKENYTLDKVKNNIKLNSRFIILNDKIIPTSIQELFIEDYNSFMNTYVSRRYTMNTLLSDSKYYSEDTDKNTIQQKMENSIFNSL